MKVPLSAIPIIYSAPMVLARNQGLKSQTRRAVSYENSTVLGGTSRATWVKIDLNSPETYRDPGPDPFGPLEISKPNYSGYEYLHARVRPGRGSEDDGVEYRVRPRLQPGDILWMREGHTVTGYRIKYRRSGIRRVVYQLTGFYNADGRRFRICLNPAESEKFSRRKRKIGNIPSIFMYRSLCRGLDKVTQIRVQRLPSINASEVIAEGLRRYPVGGTRGRYWGWSAQNVTRAGDPIYAYWLLWETINGAGSWQNIWVWIYEFKPFRGPKK